MLPVPAAEVLLEAMQGLLHLRCRVPPEHKLAVGTSDPVWGEAATAEHRSLLGWSGRAMRASLLQPCASCNSLTAPELVRPLPVKAKFRSGAGDFASATWRYLVVACLGGLFYAPGWFGPSPWRSSSDLGPRALHFHVVAESFADCLTEVGVARVSPAGDWHASVVRWDVPSCCSPPILR